MDKHAREVRNLSLSNFPAPTHAWVEDEVEVEDGGASRPDATAVVKTQASESAAAAAAPEV